MIRSEDLELDLYIRGYTLLDYRRYVRKLLGNDQIIQENIPKLIFENSNNVNDLKGKVLPSLEIILDEETFNEVRKELKYENELWDVIEYYQDIRDNSVLENEDEFIIGINKDNNIEGIVKYLKKLSQTLTKGFNSPSVVRDNYGDIVSQLEQINDQFGDSLIPHLDLYDEVKRKLESFYSNLSARHPLRNSHN